MPELRYLPNVSTLKLDADACTGCGMCEIVCPHAVFVVEDGKARIIDLDACMECGACAVNCPVDAIAVQSGVGCATGVIQGALRGTDPTCACSDDAPCC